MHKIESREISNRKYLSKTKQKPLLEQWIKPWTSRTQCGSDTSAPPSQLRVSIVVKLFNSFDAMSRNINKQIRIWGPHLFNKLISCISDWGPGQPSDHGHEEDCVSIMGAWNWKWNDWNCSFVQQFVCERRFVYYTSVCTCISSSMNAGLSILHAYAIARLWTQVCPFYAPECNSSSMNAGLSIIRLYASVLLWTQVCPSRVQQFVCERRFVHPTGVCTCNS